ncbi:MAG: RNase adapter RapZ [Magnetovibrio sp.]|nr:RNase adapter RapZ [Magnetovibrio sp.]
MTNPTSSRPPSRPPSRPRASPQASPQQTSRQVVLVTGMSGAGKTTVLKAFEDLGFEALDNVPLFLLPNVVAPTQGEPRPIAIGVDIRTRDFATQTFIDQLKGLRAQSDVGVRVLFVNCDDEELLRRYTETRHRHPLAHDRPVLDGVRIERKLVSPLLDVADVQLDTTGQTPYDVKSFLNHTFGEIGRSQAMAVFVTSFSFRKGIPRDADFVFDVRFLRNPHYDPDLNDLTGTNVKVQAYIEEDNEFVDFFANLTNLLGPMVQRFAAEGKSYLTIAVGCTGGKHRSVFIAEKLAVWLEKRDTHIRLAHRDMPTSGQACSLEQEKQNGKTS